MLAGLINNHKDQFVPNELSVCIAFEYSQHRIIVNLKCFNPCISMRNPKDYTFELHLIFAVDQPTLILQLGD